MSNRPTCQHEFDVASSCLPMIIGLEYDLNTVFKTTVEYTMVELNPVNPKVIPPNCRLRLIGDDHESILLAKRYLEAMMIPEAFCEIKVDSTEVLNRLAKLEASVKKKFFVNILFRPGGLMIIVGKAHKVKAAFDYLFVRPGEASQGRDPPKVAFRDCLQQPQVLEKLVQRNLMRVDVKGLLKACIKAGKKTTNNPVSDDSTDEVEDTMIDRLSIKSSAEEEDDKPEHDNDPLTILQNKIKSFCKSSKPPEDVVALRRKLRGRKLRPIIIDGLNVTFEECSLNKRRVDRLAPVVLFFLQAGCTDIKIVQPSWMHFFDETGLLQVFKESNFLVHCPTRAGGEHDDDLYILALALRKKGCIVSNDKFRQYVDVKSGIYKELIEDSVFPYMLVDSIFIPADPPHGKSGRPLWEHLIDATEEDDSVQK